MQRLKALAKARTSPWRTGHKGEEEGVVHVSQAAHVPQHVGQLSRLKAGTGGQRRISQRIHRILAWRGEEVEDGRSRGGRAW